MHTIRTRNGLHERVPAHRLIEIDRRTANDVMSGILPSSAAGGEQPKFTAFCKDRVAHFIVKFSPPGSDPVARRWRDILITEYHAAEAIHAVNWPASETQLIEMGGRLFLESQRFDRSGEYGRMSMVSLQAVDAEFTGIGNGWDRALHELQKQGLLSMDHCIDGETFWYLGRLINHTDMHLGILYEGGCSELRHDPFLALKNMKHWADADPFS